MYILSWQSRNSNDRTDNYLLFIDIQIDIWCYIEKLHFLYTFQMDSQQKENENVKTKFYIGLLKILEETY